MKEGWVVRPIGEIAHASLGKMLDKNKNRGTSKPYLRNLNVRWFDFDLSDLLEMRFEDHERDRYTAKKGDLLICEGGYPGRAAIWSNDEPVYFQKAIHRVRFQEPERAKWFLYYLYLCDTEGSLRSHFTGAGIQHFTGEALKRFRIPLPPLPEQQRILDILDEAFAGLATATANAEQNVENARELFYGCRDTALTGGSDSWPERGFNEVCGISSKLVDPRQAEFIDLPHIGAGNMVSQTGELISVKTAREERLKSGKFLFDTSMVLYSKIRPYLMKAARPEFSGLCSADVYPLVPDALKLNRHFLFHILLSKQFTDFAIAGSDRVGMPKINRDHLFSYRFKLPTLEKQSEIADKLDELSADSNRLENIYSQKLTALAELKQSILQMAFAGELTSTSTGMVNEAAE